MSPGISVTHFASPGVPLDATDVTPPTAAANQDVRTRGSQKLATVSVRQRTVNEGVQKQVSTLKDDGRVSE